MIYGIDYIGTEGCKDAALKAHPRGWALGALAECDGWKNGYATINQLCEKKKIPAARIHLMWKDSHKFTQRDIQETVKRAQRLAKVIRKHPKVCWYVSPWLEPDGVDKQLYSQVITACRIVLPDSVIMVTNSMNGVKVAGCISEGHHNWYRAGDEIFSFDGLECVDADMEKYQKNAKNAQLFFFWRYTFNGKYGEKDKRKRAQRDSWPSVKDIRSLRPYTKKKGKVRFPKGYIWKTHGERYAHYDQDENKAVLVSPKYHRKVQLRVKGKVIKELRGSGREGSDYYYRTDMWGIDLAKLIKRTGKRNTTAGIFADGKRIGNVNVCWRAGTFRNKA